MRAQRLIISAPDAIYAGSFFSRTMRIGRAFTAGELTELLVNGRATFNNCISSKGNKYSAVFSLEEKDGYINLKPEEFIGDGKEKKNTP